MPKKAVRFVDDHVANREDCSIVIKVGLKIWLIAYFVGVTGREMKAIGATFGGCTAGYLDEKSTT
jgi:hypothetical protein